MTANPATIATPAATATMTSARELNQPLSAPLAASFAASPGAVAAPVSLPRARALGDAIAYLHSALRIVLATLRGVRGAVARDLRARAGARAWADEPASERQRRINVAIAPWVDALAGIEYIYYPPDKEQEWAKRPIKSDPKYESWYIQNLRKGENGEGSEDVI
jgi:hypothetical protein